MKKLFLAVLIIVSLISSLAFAGADITFEWDGNTELDLAGYRIYQSATSGNYEFIGYNGGAGGGDKTSPNLVIDIQRGPNPDGIEEVTIHVEDGTWFWVFTAYNKDGIESDPSNELTAYIAAKPAPPGNVKITLIKKILAWLSGVFKPFRIT